MEEYQKNEVQEEKISFIDKFTSIIKLELDLMEDRLYKGIRTKQEADKDTILRKLKFIDDKLDIITKQIKIMNNEIDLSEVVKALEATGYKVKQ